MIISFSVENWMSFRDSVTFSMVASRERQHGDRLPKLGKYNTRVLPVAAIYGGNASGKTNFFKALNFAKMLVVKGTQPDSHLAVEGFRLDNASIDKPSRFAFELLIDETIYEFAFSVNRKAVLDEKLVVITSTSERVLYSRRGNKIDFDEALKTELGECRFTLACDVDNPLTGPRGASAIFGPQKGATPEMVQSLDAGLKHFAQIILRDLGVDVDAVAGAGAAGGMGAAMMAFLKGQLRPGCEIIAKAVGLDAAVQGADCLAIVTEWQIFRAPDFEQLATSLKDRMVFDGRNLYDPALVEGYGLGYVSIGRQPVQPKGH